MFTKKEEKLLMMMIHTELQEMVYCRFSSGISFKKLLQNYCKTFLVNGHRTD